MIKLKSLRCGNMEVTGLTGAKKKRKCSLNYEDWKIALSQKTNWKQLNNLSARGPKIFNVLNFRKMKFSQMLSFLLAQRHI